jgi:hypothetical protein
MSRRLVILALLCCSAALCIADDSLPKPKVIIPESSFLSPRQYTNAFFGFTLSVPGGCHFQTFDESQSDKPLEHFLLGEKCPEKGLTTFGISATPLLGSADDEAQKAVRLPTMGPKAVPEAVSVSGRLFWKNTIEEKTLWNQKVWRAHYATVARGFVLLFWMSSYNSGLAADFRQAFESMKFFDPAQAQQMAGSGSRPYLPEAARMRMESMQDVDIAELDAGKLQGNLYLNSSLGFSYQFPEDWIRSPQAHLQTTSEKTDPASPLSGAQATSPDRCVRVLSSFTRYNERDRGLDFNPRITLLAANPSCFIPDMKFPASLEQNSEVERYAQAVVHSLEGTRLIGRQNIKLFGINLNGHIFLELASNNAEPVKGSALLRKVHTDMVLTSIRSAWIIWLFESDTESDFGKLMKSTISFDSPQGSRR